MLAVITVDSLTDDVILDGNVTLREAVQAANADTSVDGSVAGSGADTINFSAALSGQTITLGGSELVITEALTVDGHLAGQWRDDRRRRNVAHFQYHCHDRRLLFQRSHADGRQNNR